MLFDLTETEIISIVLRLITSFLGTLGFAIVFNINKNKLWIAALVGFLVYGIYELVLIFGGNDLIASFLSSVFLSVISETLARILKTPAITFIFSGAIPIVPGRALYYTVYHALFNNNDLSGKYLLITSEVVLGLAVGIIIGSLAFSSILYIKDIHKNKQINK